MFTESEYKICNECEFIVHESCAQQKELIEAPRIDETQSLTMHSGTLTMIERLSGEK